MLTLDSLVTVSTTPFAELIGDDIVALIFKLAPTKVASRISKALDHFTKAKKLCGIDDEMGALRCIAAEEELVVAIFEWLKLNADKLPGHQDFIRKGKNHQVKLAFYPVLSQFRFALNGMLEHGITFDGFEDIFQWHIAAVRVGDQIKLQIRDEKGEVLLVINPLCFALNWQERPEEEVITKLYCDLSSTIREQRGLTVRQFVTERADYRNKLLYASDAGFVSMHETLDTLLRDVFSVALRDLLWCLAVLLSDTPVFSNWGIVNQFIALYRRVLTEAKVLG